MPSSSSSQRTGNLTANCSTLQFIEHRETCPDGFEKEQRIKALKCGTQILTRTLARRTCCPNEKEHRWSKFVPSQIGPIARHCRVHGESLHTRTTATWSPKGRQNGADQHQRSDLGYYLGLRPRRPRYISEKIIKNIYVLRRTRNSLRFNLLFSITQKLIKKMKYLE